jgi:REP element-mobilizing transposase RayT
MSHSYSNTLVHCVFSTKNRQMVLTEAILARLFPYLAGVARKNGMTALAVGGVEDHVHLLLSLPSTLAVAKAVQLVKGGSSRWLHETFPELAHFAWQVGYGAFSIGIAQVERTTRYIHGQAEHHRKTSFETEFMRFLDTQGIEHDPRSIRED